MLRRHLQTLTPITRGSRRPGLRVGVVATPWFSVPPAGYGGTESVCAGLVDGLTELGHEVLLIGAGAPLTKAAAFAATYDCPPSERLGEPLPELLHAAAAGRLLTDSPVDIVHDHSFAGPLLGRGRSVPTVVTVHSAVSREIESYYRALGDSVSLVAISNAQRRTAPDLPWAATVHNGLDVDSYPFRARKEDYVLFLGRMCAEKGVHHAIDAARAAGRPIIVAGKCTEPAERAYFTAEIEPRLGPQVTFIGVADSAAKRGLLAGARCLVFPICWDEPFGMVMIEALACGTPVVALRRASVPEVVTDGTTGYVCEDVQDLPDAINRVDRLRPADCRAAVLECYTTSTMASGYENVYRRLLDNRRAIGLSFAQRQHGPRAESGLG